MDRNLTNGQQCDKGHYSTYFGYFGAPGGLCFALGAACECVYKLVKGCLGWRRWVVEISHEP